MKTSTIVWVLVAIIVIIGGGYWVSQKQASPAEDTGNTPLVATTTNTPSVVQSGEHCGGNMQNAPVCASGLHCAPTPGSHLPFGDVGGTCVPDNAALYVQGNLLLGTDSTAKLGTYLIAYNGMTLYRYTKDTAKVSNCTGQCAVNWPPYVVPSIDALSNIQAGVNGKVGSINRADGSIQVTYNGSPLYFYVGDKNSGDTTGQNVGGVWFVLKP